MSQTAHNARNRARLHQMVAFAAVNRSCTDCGGMFDPVCMGFVHKPGTVKAFTINQGIHNCVSPDRLLAEIKKCELVCANCQALRPKAKVSVKHIHRTPEGEIIPDWQLEYEEIDT